MVVKMLTEVYIIYVSLTSLSHIHIQKVQFCICNNHQSDCWISVPGADNRYLVFKRFQNFPKITKISVFTKFQNCNI